MEEPATLCSADQECAAGKGAALGVDTEKPLSSILKYLISRDYMWFMTGY